MGPKQSAGMHHSMREKETITVVATIHTCYCNNQWFPHNIVMKSGDF